MAVAIAVNEGRVFACDYEDALSGGQRQIFDGSGWVAPAPIVPNRITELEAQVAALTAQLAKEPTVAASVPPIFTAIRARRRHVGMPTGLEMT